MIYPIFPMTKPFNEVERRFSLEAGHPRIAPLTSSYSASRFWHSENPMKISKSMGLPWKDFVYIPLYNQVLIPTDTSGKFIIFSSISHFISWVSTCYISWTFNLITLRIYMLKLLSAYITFKKSIDSQINKVTISVSIVCNNTSFHVISVFQWIYVF